MCYKVGGEETAYRCALEICKEVVAEGELTTQGICDWIFLSVAKFTRQLDLNHSLEYPFPGYT